MQEGLLTSYASVEEKRQCGIQNVPNIQKEPTEDW